MISQLKNAAKLVLPESLVKRSTSALNNLKLKKAMQAFAEAKTEPSFLTMDDLAALYNRYVFHSSYFYDEQSILARGKERAVAIMELSASRKGMNDFLELGCGDGMVSGVLQELGKKCTAVDYYDGGFDERARKAGVSFFKMDAAKMDFQDESFDFIFSYNAFEHFPRPDKVFAESLRIVRPGGLIYTEFSPLFMSSYGLHAYKSIPVPYCQHLFRESDMEQFILDRKLEPVNFTTHVNRWTIGSFRRLWKEHAPAMKTVLYEEMKNYNDLNLIWKYPTCFKSKTQSMDDLIVGGITALFQKI